MVTKFRFKSLRIFINKMVNFLEKKNIDKIIMHKYTIRFIVLYIILIIVLQQYFEIDLKNEYPMFLYICAQLTGLQMFLRSVIKAKKVYYIDFLFNINAVTGFIVFIWSTIMIITL